MEGRVADMDSASSLRVFLRVKRRKSHWFCGQRMDRLEGSGLSGRVERAMCGRGEGWAGVWLRCHPAHRAMVRAIAPAAGRHTGLCACLESHRQRPQPEKQNQKDGKRTPHQENMVHQFAHARTR